MGAALAILRLVVVAGILLVPSPPGWPTVSPHDVSERTTADDRPPAETVFP
jgi:hypothetical protein